MENSKIARQQRVTKPDDVCLRCFNSQQQLRFPFLVYCEHREVLALIRSAHESATFACAPAQLQGILARLDPRRGVAAAAPGATGAVDLA